MKSIASENAYRCFLGNFLTIRLDIIRSGCQDDLNPDGTNPLPDSILPNICDPMCH